MEPFNSALDRSRNIFRITPKPGPEAYNWEAVSAEIRKQLQAGVRNLELDIGEMPMIDSLAIGLIVGYKAATDAANGSFRLIIKRDSPPHRVIQMVKLHLMITVIER